MGTIDTIVLDIHHRTEPRDEFAASLEHFRFHPLDVDFQEIGAVRLEIVIEDDALDRAAFLELGDLDPAVVCFERIVDLRNQHCAMRRADCGVNAVDIRQVVERNVRAQHLEDQALRLECVDEAVCTDVFRKRNRVVADICTEVEDRTAGCAQLPEQLRARARAPRRRLRAPYRYKRRLDCRESGRNVSASSD